MSLAASVVIPTFNRRARLMRVLAALDQQNVPADAFEVVVVDDGSSDDTSERLEGARFGYRLRSVRQQNSGPAIARNLGVEKAEGDAIIFLDDDVVPGAELVQEHLKSQSAEPDVAVIGPLGSLAAYPQPWVAWEQAKVEAQYAAMTRGDWPPSFRQFWTGNASVPRKRILEAGGFDSRFLRAEDIELGLRMHRRGVRFRFNPRAHALHHAERTLKSWMNVHDSYGRLEVAIFDTVGKNDTLQFLADNLNRLHPATRWLVGRSLRDAWAFESARAVLCRILEVAESTGSALGTDAACGMLANLLYWRASTQALGPERSRELFLRAGTTRGPARDQLTRWLRSRVKLSDS